MEILASLFVTFVLLANRALPDANIPQVLGVKIAENSTDSAEVRLNNESEKTRELRQDFELRKKKSEVESHLKRTKLETSLLKIRSETKRKSVEKINDNLIKINQKWMENWSKQLVRLSDILTKIKVKRDALLASGKDVTALDGAIGAAENAINEAQAALNTQTSKTYNLNITTDDKLGPNVSSTVHLMRSDMKLVLEKVKIAKEAVRNAYKILRSFFRDNENESASPTGTATPAVTISPIGSPTESPSSTPSPTATL